MMKKYVLIAIWLAWYLLPEKMSGQTIAGVPEKYPEIPFVIRGHSGDLPLKVKLTVTDTINKHPLVILAGNSGFLDKESLKTEDTLFPAITAALCKNGFAVARPEFHGSCEITTPDLAGDILKVILYLNKKPYLDSTRTGLAGFDEGAIIASMAAGQYPSLRWLILVSAPALPGERTLAVRYTLHYSPDQSVTKTPADMKKNIEDIHRILKKVSDNKSAMQKISKYNPSFDPEKLKYYTSGWYRTFLGLMPEDYFKAVRCPVFCLYGADDLMTEPKLNMEALEKSFIFGGNPDYTLAEIPALDHYLMKPGKQKTGMDENPGIQSDPVKAIIDWILTPPVKK